MISFSHSATRQYPLFNNNTETGDEKQKPVTKKRPYKSGLKRLFSALRTHPGWSVIFSQSERARKLTIMYRNASL